MPRDSKSISLTMSEGLIEEIEELAYNDSANFRNRSQFIAVACSSLLDAFEDGDKPRRPNSRGGDIVPVSSWMEVDLVNAIDEFIEEDPKARRWFRNRSQFVEFACSWLLDQLEDEEDDEGEEDR